jgi:MoaA/NifB/PqqE/SkfB family radical SAM enzyme
MNVSEVAKRIAFSKAYEFLDRNPEQNFLKLVDWLEKLDKNGYVASQLPVIWKYADDPESNWYKLALSLWNDVDDEVRKTLFTNFMLNGNVLDNKRLVENRRQYRCNIPWTIVIDMSESAGADGTMRGLSFDEIDSVIEQGKELGVYIYCFCGTVSPGRRSDLIALCNKNSECVFMFQTDGLHIDAEIAQDLLRVKNCIPIIWTDGLEKETDAIHGAGTFARISESMELLKKKKVLFGVACRYNARNCETVASERYYDTMIYLGAKFASFSAYMPTGDAGDAELLLSAEQREAFHRSLKEFRKTKPLLTTDHWNDGEFMGGCLAGGRGYCYLNGQGDMEPCLYIHYTDSNIREKSLLEIMQSPLFMAFHKEQPFNRNLLRPCPLLDSPERIVSIVEKTGARATGSSCGIQELAERCTGCARDWTAAANRLWQEAGHAL